MRVAVARYPQLHSLAWSRPPGAVLDGADALALYERNWRFIDAAALDPDERALIAALVARYGNGVLHV